MPDERPEQVIAEDDDLQVPDYRSQQSPPVSGSPQETDELTPAERGSRLMQGRQALRIQAGIHRLSSDLEKIRSGQTPMREPDRWDKERMLVLDTISSCCRLGEEVDRQEMGLEELRNFMQHNEGEYGALFQSTSTVSGRGSGWWRSSHKNLTERVENLWGEEGRKLLGGESS